MVISTFWFVLIMVTCLHVFELHFCDGHAGPEYQGMLITSESEKKKHAPQWSYNYSNLISSSWIV